MAQQVINIGTTNDDGSGDTLRNGGAKINANFTELYADQANTSADAALAAAAAASAQAAEAGTLSAIAGAGGSLGTVTLQAATRTILAGLNTSLGLSAMLLEGGRQGVFVFDSTNISANCSGGFAFGDTRQGIYVLPSSDTTGASGAWVRKWQGPVWVTWFGAKGDKVTDDAPAIMSAATLFTGKAVTLYFPSHVGVGKYRCASQLVFRSNVHLLGDGWSQNPGQVGSTTYSFPDFLYGSILYCDTGVAGPLFRTYSDSDTLAGATFQNWNSTYSRIDDLMILSANNGAAALTGNHGIDSRVVLFGNRVLVRGFGDVGVRIEASTAGTTNKLGNANDSLLIGVISAGNKGDGFYIAGSDANVIKLASCQSLSNGGWGYNDDGLIGNTYDTCLNEGNATGSFRTSSAGATHTYINCENEGGLTSFAGPVNVIGGTLGQGASHPQGSPAWVMNGGLAVRAGLRHLNTAGTTTIGSQIGDKQADMAAFGFGIQDISGYREWAWQYAPRGPADSWGLRFGNAAGDVPMMVPDGINRTGRTFAIEFPRGICIGDQLGNQDKLQITGVSAPSAGTWVQGDIVWNRAPTAGGTVGWVCTTGGTPGTWKTFGTISA